MAPIAAARTTLGDGRARMTNPTSATAHTGPLTTGTGPGPPHQRSSTAPSTIATFAPRHRVEMGHPGGPEVLLHAGSSRLVSPTTSPGSSPPASSGSGSQARCSPARSTAGRTLCPRRWPVQHVVRLRHGQDRGPQITAARRHQPPAGGGGAAREADPASRGRWPAPAPARKPAAAVTGSSVRTRVRSTAMRYVARPPRRALERPADRRGRTRSACTVAPVGDQRGERAGVPDGHPGRGGERHRTPHRAAPPPPATAPHPAAAGVRPRHGPPSSVDGQAPCPPAGRAGRRPMPRGAGGHAPTGDHGRPDRPAPPAQVGGPESGPPTARGSMTGVRAGQCSAARAASQAATANPASRRSGNGSPAAVDRHAARRRGRHSHRHQVFELLVPGARRCRPPCAGRRPPRKPPCCVPVVEDPLGQHRSDTGQRVELRPGWRCSD